MSGLAGGTRQAGEKENAFLKDQILRLRELLDCVDDAVFLCNAVSGAILDFNAGASALFGYEPAELGRLSLGNLSAVDEGYTAERLGGWFHDALRHEKVRFEWRSRRRDGTPFWSDVRVTRSSLAGEPRVLVVVRDVSVLRASGDNLRLAEARYRMMVRNLPNSAIILCDQDLRIVLIDGPEVAATGFSKEAMEGRTIYETLPPDFVKAIEGNLRRVLGGETFSAEIPFGDLFYHYNYLPIRDGAGDIVYALILALNVTERRRARIALEASEDRFRVLSEATFEGIGFTDEGRIVDVNDQFAAMFATTRERMIGTQVSTYVAPEARDAVLARLKSNQVEPYEHLARRIDGSVFVAEIRPRLVQIGGKSMRVSAIRDITKQKQAALERERLIAELRAKNDEMEQFTHTVSHDLKSPLVTINGFLGLLERDMEEGDAARVRSDVARIGSAARKMMHLLDDLVELSRVGRIAGSATDVPLGEIVADALELVSGPLAERKVKVEVMPGLPTVFGDKVRLVQVVQNLLENAVKYMGDRSDPRIEIGTRPEHRSVVCYVKDNGIGIDPRYAQRIFNLFEKLDPRSEGTGVGLALVKRILEFQGGSIVVESDGIDGSTFVFRLPKGVSDRALRAGGEP